MDHQYEPPGDWKTWVLQWGRGSGKTITAAQYVRERVDSGDWRTVNIAGPTWTDTLRTMVNGNEHAPGLLGIWPEDRRPELRMSRDDPHLRCWNGAKIQLFAAHKADRFRGANADGGWADEIDYWKPERMTAAQAFSDFRFGIRTGPDPRKIATSTPRRGGLIATLIGAHGVCVTRATMLDNEENLSPEFLEDIRENTSERTWRQEALGELLPDVEGAIVSLTDIDAARADVAALARVAVGVDPYGGGGDACGISVVGRGDDREAYVLADRTCKAGPDGWGRKVIEAYLEFEADVLVVERNYGGDMAIAVITHAAESMGVSTPRFAGKKGKKGITSTKSKHERFERTTGALYERGAIHHTDTFRELEDEITQFTPTGYEGKGSPNRADALVFAVEELFPRRRSVGWGDVIGKDTGGANASPA